MKYNSEICHSSHPEHKLKYEYKEVPFKCDGCKEIGIGSCYKCTICSDDYDLHIHCALPTTPSLHHPFFPKCCFVFVSTPPGNAPRYCNACERLISGFLYHCTSCGFDLHPCCAKLPTSLDDGLINLFLYRKVSARCERCGRKGRSWSYRASNNKYNLHVACVKDMLIENWQHYLYHSPGLIGARGPTTIHDVPGLKAALLQTHSHSSHSHKSSNNNNNNNNNNSKSKGSTSSSSKKVQKCCDMAGMTLQFVISAVLGDPTSLIAGAIGSLMSR